MGLGEVVGASAPTIRSQLGKPESICQQTMAQPLCGTYLTWRWWRTRFTLSLITAKLARPAVRVARRRCGLALQHLPTSIPWQTMVRLSAFRTTLSTPLERVAPIPWIFMMSRRETTGMVDAPAHSSLLCVATTCVPAGDHPRGWPRYMLSFARYQRPQDTALEAGMLLGLRALSLLSEHPRCAFLPEKEKGAQP